MATSKLVVVKLVSFTKPRPLKVGVGFNRDAWNLLEKTVRSMTNKFRNVYVCTGPLYLPRLVVWGGGGVGGEGEGNDGDEGADIDGTIVVVVVVVVLVLFWY